MELEQVIVAFGIAIFLGAFLTGLFSFVYPHPNYSASSPTSCMQLITDQCGDSSSAVNYTEYSKCRSVVTQSSEYKGCVSQATSTKKLDEYKSKLQIYNLISLIVFGFFGILLVAVGFSISHFKSIGSGFILSGFFILIFSNLLIFLSNLSGGLVGSSSVADPGMQTVSKLIGLFLNLIVLVLIIVLGYIHVDKRT